MSHIDETRISAFVDGDPSLALVERNAIRLHLQECEACSGLAREIEANADAARDILSTSGPDVIRKPAFEDLVVRAQERTVKSAKRLKWWVNPGLAAAAVLVIAVSVSIYSGQVDQIVYTAPSTVAAISPGDSTRFQDRENTGEPLMVAALEEDALPQIPTADAPLVSRQTGTGQPRITGAVAATPGNDVASISGAPAEAVVRAIPEADQSAGAIAPGLAGEAGGSGAGELETRVRLQRRRAARERPPPVAAVAALANHKPPVEEDRECPATASRLASNGSPPVALECAVVLAVEADTLGGTALKWISQQLEGGAVVWLVVASTGDVQPGFRLALTAAMATKWQDAGRDAEPANGAFPDRDVIETEVDGYLVWVTGRMSRTLLEGIAARLVVVK